MCKKELTRVSNRLVKIHGLYRQEWEGDCSAVNGACSMVSEYSKHNLLNTVPDRQATHGGEPGAVDATAAAGSPALGYDPGLHLDEDVAQAQPATACNEGSTALHYSLHGTRRRNGEEVGRRSANTTHPSGAGSSRKRLRLSTGRTREETGHTSVVQVLDKDPRHHHDDAGREQAYTTPRDGHDHIATRTTHSQHGHSGHATPPVAAEAGTRGSLLAGGAGAREGHVPQLATTPAGTGRGVSVTKEQAAEGLPAQQRPSGGERGDTVREQCPASPATPPPPANRYTPLPLTVSRGTPKHSAGEPRHKPASSWSANGHMGSGSATSTARSKLTVGDGERSRNAVHGRKPTSAPPADSSDHASSSGHAPLARSRGASAVGPPASAQRAVQVPSYKYTEVVRNKAKRAAMPGYSCEHCRAFVDAVAGTEHDKRQMLDACSRHRHEHKPADTPEGFWDLSFVDSVVGSPHPR